MKRNVKISLLLILLIPVILLCGCTPGEITYEIKEKDGEYLMVFRGDVKSLSGGDSTCETPYIEVESISDLRNKLVKNDFSQSELQRINRVFPKDKERNVRIVNPSHMTEPLFPDDETLVRERTYWGGTSYFVEWKTAFCNGTSHFIPQNQYDIALDGAYDLGSVFILSENVLSDGKTTEIIYKSSNSKGKQVRYELTNDQGMTLQIVEDYLLETTTDLIASETVPQSVKIFGEQKGQYFRTLILDFDYPPTEEWLSSFSLSPLEATE